LIVCQDRVVPANRRPVPKEQRREELLIAAARLFVEEGYDAASMTRIAKQAGVTANTLYWYFGDKDELLVAVADGYLEALLAEHRAIQERPLAEQLLWLIERLRPVKHLVATVHDRLSASAAIGAWHERFHSTFEDVFEDQLPRPLPNADRDAEIAAATFAIEGAITHPLDDPTTQALCRLLARRLHRAATEAGALEAPSTR
jgi:AcrR family transcriptional regulator